MASFRSATGWSVEHPQTLFAWEGACIQIPCKYKVPKPRSRLDSILLFQNYTFDNTTRDFTGKVLYNNTKASIETELYFSQQDRVTFLGNRSNNCTLKIDPIHANDSGKLGLRLISGTDKWMEHIHLNVSGKAWEGS